MTFEYLAFLVAGAAAGGFVNGLAGFGTSLFALGWWLQIMPPLQAVVLSLVLSIFSGLQGVWLVRKSIEPSTLGRFVIPALFGIPIGLTILQWIEAGPLKLVVAVFLLLYGGFFAFRRDLPSMRHPTPVIDIGIGFLGGILGAIAGLSGALPTMWLAMRDWTKARTRAVLQPFNVIVLGLSAVALAIDGAYDRATLITIAIALPVTMISAQVGIWSFGRLADAQFRRLLIGLMLASGLMIVAREIL